MKRGRKRRRAASAPGRYASLRQPQAELDFHGRGSLTPGDVRRLLLGFLDEARRDGLERVRVISGKGLHSRGRPVVRPQVLRTLRAEEEAGRIAAFETEKETTGGDGAFFVRL